MIYNSKDILFDNIYEDIAVVLITGHYDSIINMVVDTIKDKYSTKVNNSEIDNIMKKEFNIESVEESVNNTVDFDTFFEVVKTPSVSGKWICICDLDSMSKKHYDKVVSYINKPSKFGILIIKSTDYKVYNKLANKNKFKISKNVNHISLSFPDQGVMKKIISEMIKEKGKSIDNNAIQHLMIKLNGNYKDIVEIVEMITSEINEDTIKLPELRKLIKNIEYFSVNDFIEELTKPLMNDNTNNKKVYRMMADMIDTYGASNLVGLLIKSVDTMIDLRVLINRGTIPVKINYFYSDVIKEISKDSRYSKYAKMKEYTLRKRASIAAQTSLRDWVFIRLMLEKVKYNRDENACIRAIYDVVIRSVLNKDRLLNIIGVDNVIDKEETVIDSISFDKNS